MIKVALNLFVLSLLLITTTAFAYDPIDDQSVNVTVRYTEPTQNTDNSPLTDLKQILIYYNLGKGDSLGIAKPATSPTGGRTVEVKFPVPVPAGSNVEVLFYSRAINSTGQQSSKSNSVKLLINRL